MLKLICALIFLLPLHLMAEQQFPLGKLMNSASRHRAPSGLQKLLAAEPSNRDSLLRCKADKRYKLNDIEEFFAAVPVALGQNTVSFLVFPAKYCPGFFGAHSIPFWVVEHRDDGTYRELFFGAEDVVTLLDSRTRGYRDIGLRYGHDPLRVAQFNGSVYVEK